MAQRTQIGKVFPYIPWFPSVPKCFGAFRCFPRDLCACNTRFPVKCFGEKMSEFKFACPVCGQHITAASESSGTQIECPTCFQKIVVPQARASDSKFILNAAQADKPRPVQAALRDTAAPRRSRSPLLGGFLVLLLVAGAGAALFAFRSELGLVKHPVQGTTNSTASPLPGASALVPGGVVWTTNLNKVNLPDAPVAGALRGQSFTMSRATLQGGNLSIRQGRGSPAELAVSIVFPAQHGEELGGKKVRVTHDQAPPRPRVGMRWKNDEGKAASRSYTNGYSLLLEFGKPANGRMPGKLYLAFPDGDKSVVAGSFDAEIRAPRPRTPTPPARS
jgi:DNA-directed RNA polymerase subunit RPC12/RpoP